MPADQTGWSDERLEAAFRQRAARTATPAHLVASTLDRVAGSGAASRPRSRPALPVALAAAIVVAIVAGTTLITRLSDGPASTAVAPSANGSTPPVATPIVTATAAAPAWVLTLEQADGRNPTTATVADESGQVVDAAAMDPMDWPVGAPTGGRTEAASVVGRADQVRIGWLGGVCDGPTALAIQPDGRTIEVTRAPGGGDLPCPAIGLMRGVVLTFDGPVDASDIVIVEQSPAEGPPRVIPLVFDVGERRLTVEVVDESGRLLRAAPVPRDAAPGRPRPEVRATGIEGRPDQVRIDWLGSACDQPTRLTIDADARSIEFTTTDGPVDASTFCMLGGVPRGVILTFDGPVRAEDLAIVGRPPGRELVALEAIGLPVMTVEEALRHRDQALDDTELAVAGYWYRLPSGERLGCPDVRFVSPILPSCQELGAWVTAEPGAGSDGDFSPPTGPAIQPIVRNAVSMADGSTRVAGDPVVLVGHFDDHRAGMCTGDIVGACRGSFVVDVVLDPADPVLDLGRVERFGERWNVDTIASVEDVERVATEAPRGAVQVVAVFSVAGSDLGVHEPQARVVPELTAAPAVWIVRYLDPDGRGRPVVRTKLMIDGPPESLRDHVYEATSSGVAPFGSS